jgi:hypothetical protein
MKIYKTQEEVEKDIKNRKIGFKEQKINIMEIIPTYNINIENLRENLRENTKNHFK